MIEGVLESLAEMIQQHLPEGVTLLPRDWKGETTRVWLSFAVSRQAECNEKFDLKGFLISKLNNSLTAIRRRRNIKELRLTHRLRVEIVQNWPDKTKFYFHIEFANDDRKARDESEGGGSAAQEA